MVDPSVRTDPQQSRRVLVYDDDKVLLDLLKLVLKREGYHIHATDCIQEGIRLMSTERFDVVVADLGLRRSIGYELVRRIREVSPETAIVAVSACPSDEVVRFARKHAQAFLDKPFSLIEFVHQVGSLLEQDAQCSRRTSGQSQESDSEMTEVRSWEGHRPAGTVEMPAG
jgi:DNA-binding response OmpR family regulator